MSRALRVLGVFAHPDDEVICAGGTLARYAADGAEVMVVSATRGEAGQILDSCVATRATLGRVREQELRDACARVGVQHVRCLDYLDGSLRVADRQVLTAEIAAIVDDFQPEVVITFGEDGAYGHPDHVVIGEVATTVCCTQRLYHCHFPQGGVMLSARLAAWLVQLGTPFTGSEEFAHALCVLASEATMMRLARDTVKIAWYPSGARIVEAQEAARSLHFVLAGQVDVVGQSNAGGSVSCRQLGPGQFFGELELAKRRRHISTVVAVESTTCLVLSDPDPAMPAAGGRFVPARLVCCDASAWIDQKMLALAAHRTQFPIRPEMFPRSLLLEMFGREYFVPAATSMSGWRREPGRGAQRPREARGSPGGAAGDRPARRCSVPAGDTMLTKGIAEVEF